MGNHSGGVDGRGWRAFRWVWYGEVGGRSEQGADKGHPLLPRRGANKRSEQGTPTPATRCGHGHLPQPLGSERPHVDHVVGAGAGTGGNVVRRSAGKDAWRGANKGHPLLSTQRSEQGTPTPATRCGHGHLPQPLGSERPHVDHVVGAGAGTGGNVVRRSAGKDAWCPAVVASEGPTRHPPVLSGCPPIGTPQWSDAQGGTVDVPGGCPPWMSPVDVPGGCPRWMS